MSEYYEVKFEYLDHPRFFFLLWGTVLFNIVRFYCSVDIDVVDLVNLQNYLFTHKIYKIMPTYAVFHTLNKKQFSGYKKRYIVLEQKLVFEK